MSILEDQKIVIRLPQFQWRWFLNLRFAIGLSIVVFISLFAYWYQSIRPFMWINVAQVEAFSTVIGTDVAGRIIEMGPQEGEFVRKGQTLFVLDRDLVLAKQMQSRRSIDTLNEEIHLEKERLDKAMEDYLSASAELEMGIGSQDTLRKNLTMMQEAQAKWDLLSSQLLTLQTENSLFDVQARKMTLTAPFDGIVLKRSQNPGAVVTFGESVYVVCDPNRIWVDAQIHENQLRRIKVGTLARVRLSAYPGQEWGGKISWIGPSADKSMIPIKISLQKPDESFKPGLSAQIGLKVH